jgi:hypothetical protein
VCSGEKECFVTTLFRQARRLIQLRLDHNFRLYLAPAADHQEIERKLQTKATLRDRKNARLRELNPK